MNNIIILDPSCIRDTCTHHMNAVMGYARTFIEAGHNVILGTNIDCRIDHPNIDNNPVFNYTIYDDIKSNGTNYYFWPIKKIQYYLLMQNTYYLISDLLRCKHIDDADHIFIPIVDWILFQSIVKIYMKRKINPFIHFLLVLEQADWMTGGYPYRKIINILIKLNHLQKKIFIYTETARHAKYLANDLGFIPSNYPFPAFPLDKSDCLKKSDEKIYVGALGGGRRDKGYHLLPDVINKFNRSFDDNSNVIFIIQCAKNEDSFENETELLRKIKNVVLLDNNLTKHDYEKYLLKCDITIFPYSDAYFIRGSGIVNEAVANSIPIVCSANTVLSEAITCENGKLATSVDEFAISIINIIKNLDQYKTNAKNAKDRFLHQLYNNPVIKNIKLMNSQRVIQA